MLINNLLPYLVVFLLTFTTANAQLSVVFGSEQGAPRQASPSGSPGPEQGNDVTITEIFSTTLGINNRQSAASINAVTAGTSINSPYTVGTLNTANPARVSFDIVFAVSANSNANDQNDGLGVHGGGSNNAIDNYFVGRNSNVNQDASLTNQEANLEWISIKLDNVTGLAPGEQLVFTELYTLFATPSTSSRQPETYRLTKEFDLAPTAADQSIFGKAVGGKNSVGGRNSQYHRFEINSSQFTIGSGTRVDESGEAIANSFILNGLTIDVVKVP